MLEVGHQWRQHDGLIDWLIRKTRCKLRKTLKHGCDSPFPTPLDPHPMPRQHQYWASGVRRVVFESLSDPPPWACADHWRLHHNDRFQLESYILTLIAATSRCRGTGCWYSTRHPWSNGRKPTHTTYAWSVLPPWSTFIWLVGSDTRACQSFTSKDLWRRDGSIPPLA